MRSHHLSGFSLLELLIAVAIIGVLASVAYPAYTDSLRKGKRAQARTAIAEVLQQQERFMTQRNCYMAFTTAANGIASVVEDADCGVAAGSAVPFKFFSGDSLAAASYLLTASACPLATGTLSMRECVRVEAQPVQADPTVGSLWMTSTGMTGCTGPTSSSSPPVSPSSGRPACWP